LYKHKNSFEKVEKMSNIPLEVEINHCDGSPSKANPLKNEGCGGDWEERRRGNEGR